MEGRKEKEPEATKFLNRSLLIALVPGKYLLVAGEISRDVGSKPAGPSRFPSTGRN